MKRFERNHHLRANGRVNQRVWNLVARAARAKAARPKPLPPPTGPAPAIVGHRGAVTPDTPENTLASMHRGAAYAAVLEFDLRLTADHQIVLMHDVTLDRTTNCTGRVIDWTLQNLRAQCHVGSQPIPTFDEVAAYAETTTLKIAPEIKNADISDADLGQVFSIIDAHGLQGRTIMQSFEAPVLQRVHALRPDLRLMLVSTEPVTVAAARAAYATTVAIRLENLTAAQVANYKRNSMKVWTFTAHRQPDPGPGAPDPRGRRDHRHPGAQAPRRTTRAAVLTQARLAPRRSGSRSGRRSPRTATASRPPCAARRAGRC